MSPRDWCIGRTAIVRILVRAAAALALLALLGPAAARGDDRDLLRTTIADPYLFILLDTSGSMNWSPKGDHLPVRRLLRAPAGRRCGLQVLPGQGGALRGADRPRPAQGGAGLRHLQPGPARHRPRSTGSTRRRANGVLLTGSTYFPAAGSREVFGNAWTCDTGNSDHEIGCYAASPADLDDTWELTRVQRLPKGGRTFTTAQTFYIRTAGITYKVTYTPNGGSGYGGNINVKAARPQVQQRRVLEHHVGRHADRQASRRSATSSPGTTRAPTRTAPIRRSATTPASPSTRSPTTPVRLGSEHRHRQRQEPERLQPALADRQLGPPGDLVHPRRRHPAGLEDGPQGRHPEAAGAELRRQLDGPRFPHRRPSWRTTGPAPRPSCGSRTRTSAR